MQINEKTQADAFKESLDPRGAKLRPGPKPTQTRLGRFWFEARTKTDPDVVGSVLVLAMAIARRGERKKGSRGPADRSHAMRASRPASWRTEG